VKGSGEKGLIGKKSVFVVRFKHRVENPSMIE